MKILNRTHQFSHILGCYSFTEITFFLQFRIKLSSFGQLENQVEIVIIFEVVIKLDYIFMIELIHYTKFQLYLCC